MLIKEVSSNRCRPICLAVGILVLAFQAALTAGAAETPIEQVGRWPAFFNGRLTTWDAVARIFLQRFSGRDTYVAADAQPQAAVEWLLDEAAGGERLGGHPILLIDDPQLQQLFGLEPRPAPGPLQNRYAVEELVPKIAEFDREQQRIREQAGAEPSDYERAVTDLAGRLMGYMTFRQSLEEITSRDSAELRETIPRVESLGDANVPALVPPEGAGGAWTCLARASLENAIIEVVQPEDRRSNPAVGKLAEVFRGHREQDADGLAAAVAGYAGYLKENLSAKPAFDFAVPAGWREQGVSVVNQEVDFSDTLARGATVAAFTLDSGTAWCSVRVNYFAGETASAERIVNHWRIESLRAPLAPDALQRGLTPVRVAGCDGVSTDIVTPDGLSQHPARTLATIFKREGDTWVISLHGTPALVEENREKYGQFLESLRLGTPSEVKAWFALREGEPNAGLADGSMMLALVSDAPRTWLFAFGSRGELPQAARDNFLKFVEAFPLPGADIALGSAPSTDWVPPAGWTANPDADSFASYWLEADGQVAFVTVHPLADFTEASVLPLVNEWRSALSLPLVAEADVEQHATRGKAGTRDVRWLEIGSHEPPPAPDPK